MGRGRRERKIETFFLFYFSHAPSSPGVVGRRRELFGLANCLWAAAPVLQESRAVLHWQLTEPGNYCSVARADLASRGKYFHRYAFHSSLKLSGRRPRHRE